MKKDINVLTDEDIEDWKTYWEEFFYEYSTDVAEGALSLIATIRDRDKAIIALSELLTSHAPKGHNVTNEQYVKVLLENEQLKKQLSKYERVVNVAKSYVYAMRDDYSDDIDQKTKLSALCSEIDSLKA